MRRAAKRDTVEPEIFQALRQVGADVLVLDKFDALVLFGGRLTMLDCKATKGRPTKSQEQLIERGWPLVFVRSVDEALRAIGAVIR